MTAPTLESRRPYDGHHVLLDAVGHALGEVVRAVVDGDRELARGVFRDGGRRRALVRSAEEQIRGADEAPGPRAVLGLLFVSDVARASQLIDELARLMLAGRAATRFSPGRLEALMLLGRFGEERLHQLADGVRGPGLDREFVRCGRCLLEAAERLGRVTAVDGDPAEPTASCCTDLATTVLQASRHALRAAAS